MKKISLDLKKTLALFFLPTLLSLGFYFYNLNFLPHKVGLFFFNTWGEERLALPKYLLGIPAFLTVSFALLILLCRYFEKEGKNEQAMVIRYLSVVWSFVCNFLFFNLVNRFSFNTHLVDTQIFSLVLPWVFGFISIFLFGPITLKIANKYNLIDDPKTHNHPGQLLTSPVPRGGALAFFLGFLLVSLIFVSLNKKTLGIYLGLFVLVIIGLIDDRKKYTSPKIRLFLQFLSAGLVVAGGVGISYIANPFGEIIRLDKVVLPFNFLGNHSIVLFADIFALIWLVFLANAVSWSNGIDGQFAGFAGITALVISLISLKTGISDNDPTQMSLAVLGAIASGCSFGMLKFTWFPQKILWGFGATSFGLLIGALSILSLSKVYIVSMVLLVPLIDAVVTGTRRILQKKSPFWGDRGHLHHRLLDLGWKKPQISLFYIAITAVFGILALFSNENDIDMDVVRFGAMGVFVVVVLNLVAEVRKQHKGKVAEKSQ